MSLAQDIRNAFDARSSDSLELCLVKVRDLEKPPAALICTDCHVNRLVSPCRRAVCTLPTKDLL